MSTLPFQIKNKIALQLKQSEVFTCTKVCKLWKYLFSSNLLWKSINANHPLIRKNDPLNNTNPFKAYLQNERIKHNIDELNFKIHDIFPSNGLGFDIDRIWFNSFWNNDLIIEAEGSGQKHFLVIKDDGSVRRLNDVCEFSENSYFEGINCITNIVGLNDKLIASTDNGEVFELSTERPKRLCYFEQENSFTKIVRLNDKFIASTSDGQIIKLCSEKGPKKLFSFAGELISLIPLQDNLLVVTSELVIKAVNTYFYNKWLTLLTPKGQVVNSINIEQSDVLSLGKLLCISNENSFKLFNARLELIGENKSLIKYGLSACNENLILTDNNTNDILSISADELLTKNVSPKYLCRKFSSYTPVILFNHSLIGFQVSNSDHTKPDFNILNFKDAIPSKCKAIFNDVVDIYNNFIF
ncbi:MAG: F-box protein, partial [Parachlamydiales bacterium]|nr:F-box protein [Parachlamydiales bacterium]